MCERRYITPQLIIHFVIFNLHKKKIMKQDFLQNLKKNYIKKQHHQQTLALDGSVYY